MSKEFEALDRLYKCNDDDYTLGYQQHDYKLLQQALTELKAIKEANPSEALKDLKDLRDYLLRDRVNISSTKYYNTIEQALLKAQENEKRLKGYYEQVEIVDALSFEKILEMYKESLIIGTIIDAYTKLKGLLPKIEELLPKINKTISEFYNDKISSAVAINLIEITIKMIEELLKEKDKSE